jgi:AcrR family transcriptional regulator
MFIIHLLQNRGDKMARTAKISKEMIVEAAFQYADEFGLENVSMRSIASRLQVKAMSLYNHIKNKDELIDEMVEKLVSEIEIPTMGDTWQNAMRKRSWSIHRVLLKHPWGTKTLMSRPNIGPHVLTLFDRSLGVLKQASFTNEEADKIITAFNSFIYGFTMIVQNFPLEEPEYADAAKEHAFLFPKDVYPSLHDLSKDIEERKYSGFADFNVGLELIISGIEHTISHKEK